MAVSFSYTSETKTCKLQIAPVFVLFFSFFSVFNLFWFVYSATGSNETELNCGGKTSEVVVS